MLNSLARRWRPAVGWRPLAGIAAGILLLLAGTPRLVAAILAAPGDAAAARLGAHSSADDLATVAASRAAALRWHASGRDLEALGRAEAALAGRRDASTPASRALVRRAQTTLAQGLSRMPVAAAAWLDLARLRLAAGGGEAAGAAHAAILAIQTAPADAALQWDRLDVALAAYPAVPVADRPLVAIEFRNAWAADPARAVAIVRSRHGEAVAAAALAGDPDGRARLATMLGSPPAQ